MRLRLRPIRARIRSRDVTRGLLGWAALVCALFLWQTLSYSGLAAVAAEWQFDRFGRYYPTLTLLLLAFIVGSPALYLLRRRIRVSSAAQPDAVRTYAMRQAWRFRRVLIVLSGVGAAATLVTLLLLIGLPSAAGPPRRVVVGAPGSISPDEGLTTLVGRVLYDRTSALDENLLLFRRGFRFAPVQAPGGSGPQIRYFIEVAARDGAGNAADTRTGILRRGALPGEIIRLYRYAGYDINEPHYVLYDDVTSMRWPYYVTAAHLAFVTLVLAAAAAFQHRRWHRLKTPPAEELLPAEEAPPTDDASPLGETSSAQETPPARETLRPD